MAGRPTGACLVVVVHRRRRRRSAVSYRDTSVADAATARAAEINNNIQIIIILCQVIHTRVACTRAFALPVAAATRESHVFPHTPRQERESGKKKTYIFFFITYSGSPPEMYEKLG